MRIPISQQCKQLNGRCYREEQDEETEWESEQLRRSGLNAPSSSSVAKAKPVYKAAPSTWTESQHQLVLSLPMETVPPATAPPTLASAVDKLALQLAALTTSHASNTSLLSANARERDEVEQREHEMRSLVERAENKRAWFSSFREWLESVAGFLDEKVSFFPKQLHIQLLTIQQYPALENLEEEHISLLEERHNMIRNRRQAEDTVDLDTFIGPLPVESGEDAASKTISKIERKEARIMRLQQQQIDGEDGYSTDGGIPDSDEAAYRSALTSLAGRTKDVLSDVKAADFKDPGKGRWNSWRSEYADSYFGAYGGLGVVSVWEFWARLELVGWNPIEVMHICI